MNAIEGATRVLITGVLAGCSTNAGVRPSPTECLSFKNVANIEYVPAVWNPTTGAYESIFVQKSKPGERGHVNEEDIQKGGTLYEQGEANPLIIFSPGTRVDGYIVDTETIKVPMPDGTTITGFRTCYKPLR